MIAKRTTLSIETVPVEMAEVTSSDEIAQWVGVNLNSEEEEEQELSRFLKGFPNDFKGD